MKALAFVDLHGSKKAYSAIKKKIQKEKPDFLICAGDFTIFEEEIERLMLKLSKLDGKIFLVHGNHEEEGMVKDISKKYKNVEFVHSRVVKYKDLIIIGWGGGGFTIRDIEFEAWARSIKKELKKYKEKKTIFVCHAPPYRTKLDVLSKAHHGNKSFRKFIREFKIDLTFCGHFHENSGKEDLVKGCKVVNPGPKGKVVTV